MKYSLLLFFAGCCIFISCSKNDAASERPDRSPRVVTGKNYSADEITAFKQLTTGATNGSIKKWPTPVSVYLVDTAYPYLTKELDSIINEINRVSTNLVLTRTTDRITSSLRVYLTDRDTYLKQEPSSADELQKSDYTPGYTHIDWNSRGEIYYGSSFVDMYRTAGDTLQQRYIIHHELMHALGFLGHVNLPQISTILFYYTLTPYVLDYTDFDKKMMLLLYNPAIKPGMNETEFNTVVKDL